MKAGILTAALLLLAFWVVTGAKGVPTECVQRVAGALK